MINKTQGHKTKVFGIWSIKQALCILLLCLASQQTDINETHAPKEALHAPVDEKAGTSDYQPCLPIPSSSDLEQISLYLEGNKDIFIYEHMDLLCDFFTFESIDANKEYTLKEYQNFVALHPNASLLDTEHLVCVSNKEIQNILAKHCIKTPDRIVMFLMANYALLGKTSKDQISLPGLKIVIKVKYPKDIKFKCDMEQLEKLLSELPTISCTELWIGATKKENFSNKAISLLFRKFVFEHITVLSDGYFKYPSNKSYFYECFSSSTFEVYDPVSTYVAESIEHQEEIEKLEKPAPKGVCSITLNNCKSSFISFIISKLDDRQVEKLCVEEFYSSHEMDFFGNIAWAPEYHLVLKNMDTPYIDLSVLQTIPGTCSSLKILRARKPKRVLGLEALISSKKIANLEIDWLLFQEIDKSMFSTHENYKYVYTVPTINKLVIRYAPMNKKKYLPTQKYPVWIYIDDLVIVVYSSKNKQVDLSTLYKEPETIAMGLFCKKKTVVKKE
ncbi:hypothetical protein NEFER03_0939 [Nematocida sp. LUAm3]|nr:hypothetical protein NEFER03_0939 [Nematocida sp. LUAm3]KAI5174957.1 hypothetical protein NEFER02_1057 [Nematocida sp. LUAm2]KAI5177444.1 hypothetical protein NEFER01_0694 [Nematocida sp. LUAm1]